MGKHLPQSAATFLKPGVELVQAVEAGLARLLPQPLAAVLDVLLHHALLPARRHAAELGVEQVMRRHDAETGVDDPPLALADLVHRRLHVVVDAPPGHPAKGPEGAGAGIEDHLPALAGIGHQQERAAGAQLGVGDLQAAFDAADGERLGARSDWKASPHSNAKGTKALDNEGPALSQRRVKRLTVE
jgi:hypothetical protein